MRGGDAAPVPDPPASAAARRKKNQLRPSANPRYATEGTRRSVAALLLAHAHGHPHALLLEAADGGGGLALPGGRLRPGEDGADDKGAGMRGWGAGERERGAAAERGRQAGPTPPTPGPTLNTPPAFRGGRPAPQAGLPPGPTPRRGHQPPAGRARVRWHAVAPRVRPRGERWRVGGGWGVEQRAQRGAEWPLRAPGWHVGIRHTDRDARRQHRQHRRNRHPPCPPPPPPRCTPSAPPTAPAPRKSPASLPSPCPSAPTLRQEGAGGGGAGWGLGAARVPRAQHDAAPTRPPRPRSPLGPLHPSVSRYRPTCAWWPSPSAICTPAAPGLAPSRRRRPRLRPGCG